MDTAKLDQLMSLSLTRIPKLSNFDDFGILVLCKVSRKDLGDKQHQISCRDNYNKFYLLLLFDHRGLGFGV